MACFSDEVGLHRETKEKRDHLDRRERIAKKQRLGLQQAKVEACTNSEVAVSRHRELDPRWSTCGRTSIDETVTSSCLVWLNNDSKSTRGASVHRPLLVAGHPVVH